MIISQSLITLLIDVLLLAAERNIVVKVYAELEPLARAPAYAVILGRYACRHTYGVVEETLCVGCCERVVYAVARGILRQAVV